MSPETGPAGLPDRRPEPGAGPGPGPGDLPVPRAAAGADPVDDVLRESVRALSLAPITDITDASPGPGAAATRWETGPDTVDRDLIKLVLTVVELLRQLMERSALRRVDHGDLGEDQEERVGMTLMLLEERIEELSERHGLTMADLNLDLGPLGTLLPRRDQ